MATKVAIFPQYKKADHGEGGIRRVVEAQVRHLPDFGVQVVDSADEANVIACHGTTLVTRPGASVVSHNHGMYWSRYDWPEWAYQTNLEVIEALSTAQAHTAPSRWVADALRRGMLIYPEVVYHGVDYDEWQKDVKSAGYVLWNKARADLVSDPADLNAAARALPRRWFVSTFGAPSPNIRLVGKVDYPTMRALVQEAGVYLCTARETFGIGTLEAMAAGVPVAGWAWGGQLEIIRQGETGWLAPPGDFTALAQCIENCLADRQRLSDNCRQDVRARWGWAGRVAQYARIYQQLHAITSQPRPAVSVIIPCHNLARFLGEAIQSVQTQAFEDWECIVVDDASGDGTPGVAKVYTDADQRVRYVRTPENLGLSGARNFGFSNSRGRYVIFLDADDMLGENALAEYVAALDANPRIHIAAGHLDVVDSEGKNRRRNNWPAEQFDWYGQMAHMNQIHYASMMRREVVERSGGFRVRDWRAEDAAFWCRVTSLGFRAAKVTQAATLVYRDRADSKSKGEPGDGPWTESFAWSLTHKFERDASVEAARRPHPAPSLVPFGAQGNPRRPPRSWPVHDHTAPVISVVIPVGPGHERYVIDALDSLVAQRYLEWEAIVVNATGKPWVSRIGSPVTGAPFARVVQAPDRLGPAAARNLGAEHARGSGILFLDADDYLMPTALEKLVAVFLETGGLIYSDMYLRYTDNRKPMEIHVTEDFRCGAVLDRMRHSSQVLVPKEAHQKVGGFDSDAPGWEDWDYLIALQAAGVCSYRLPEPLFVYRKTTGTVREASWERRVENAKWIRRKWIDQYEGRANMPCGGCPKPSGSVGHGGRLVGASQMAGGDTLDGDAVLLTYQGPGPNRVAMRGKRTGTIYQFRRGVYRYVDSRDAEEFLGRMAGDGTHHFAAKKAELLPVPPPPASVSPASPSLFGDAMSELVPLIDPATLPHNIAKMDLEAAKEFARTVDLELVDLYIDQEKAGEARKPVLSALRYWRHKRREPVPA